MSRKMSLCLGLFTLAMAVGAFVDIVAMFSRSTQPLKYFGCFALFLFAGGIALNYAIVSWHDKQSNREGFFLNTGYLQTSQFFAAISKSDEVFGSPLGELTIKILAKRIIAYPTRYGIGDRVKILTSPFNHSLSLEEVTAITERIEFEKLKKEEVLSLLTNHLPRSSEFRNRLLTFLIQKELLADSKDDSWKLTEQDLRQLALQAESFEKAQNNLLAVRLKSYGNPPMATGEAVTPSALGPTPINPVLNRP